MLSLETFKRLKDLQNECYAIAEEHGFHEARLNQDARIARNMTVLALFTSEIGEAIEALRHVDTSDYFEELRKKDGYYEELADLFIRFLDHIGELEKEDPDFDFTKTLMDKIAFNRTRPKLHGKNV